MPSQVTTVHLFFIMNHPNLTHQVELYFSSDVLKKADETPSDATEQTLDYLALLTHPNALPHRPDLKINAVCATQPNLFVEKELVRNCPMRITVLHRCFVEVQIPNNTETLASLASRSPILVAQAEQ
jgi:hypothetical protein